MNLKNILFLGTIAGFIFTGCSTKKAPTQGDAGAGGPDQVQNMDSVIMPAKVDPNAKDGENTVKYPNGVIKARGYFKGGKRDGEWQAFFPDGKLQSDEYFNNGYPDGKAVVYYDDGQEMYEGQYRSGKPVGTWKFWKKGSTIPRVADYDKKAPNTAF